MKGEMIIDEHGHRYRILKSVGMGFYGAASKAWDEKHSGKVLVKQISLADNSLYLEQFLGISAEEARRHSELQFQREVELLKIAKRYRGQAFSNGKHYLILRYFKGKPISKKYPKLNLDERMHAFNKARKQLKKIHRAGFLHLDVHAGNIIKGKKKNKVIDFGCATPLVNEVGSSYLLGGHIPVDILESYTGSSKMYQFNTGSDFFSLGMTFWGLEQGEIFEYDPKESCDALIKRYHAYYQKLSQLAPQSEWHEQLLDMIGARHRCLAP